MGEQMNIKELAARVLLADQKELADAIGEVEETKRVLNRLGGAEQMKHSSPVVIIQRDYGYVFEAHEKNDTVLVRRVYGVKNPHYIASQGILSVKAVDGGVSRPARYRRPQVFSARSQMRIFQGALNGRSRGHRLASDIG